MNTILGWCCIYLALMLTHASAQDYQYGFLSHPKKLAAIRSIMVAPVNFDCFHLTSGGIREYDDSVSSAAKQMVTAKVTQQITQNGFPTVQLPNDTSTLRTLRNYHQFYSVVNSSIMQYFTGPAPFPNARSNFRFLLPPIDDLLFTDSSQALLIINGFDDRSTKKRNNAKVGAAVASAVGIAAAVLIGVGGTITIPPDMTYATCALVNKQGQIIWYNAKDMPGNYDMANEFQASELIHLLLNTLRKGQ